MTVPQHLTGIRLRTARYADVPELTALIETSARTLQLADYTALQIERALTTVYGVDSTLIDDETYVTIEAEGRLVACGGWSRRGKLYGSDRYGHAHAGALDPAHDAAKIRAFFIDPDYARHGLGTLLLDECERGAHAAGFRQCELGATRTGVRLFEKRGYVAVRNEEVPLGDGITLPIVHMQKTFVTP